jgi:hypothetical protein
VIASLEDLDLFVIDAVDEAVFVVDASRPVAGEVSFERLGLADAVERIALDLADATNDAVMAEVGRARSPYGSGTSALSARAGDGSAPPRPSAIVDPYGSPPMTPPPHYKAAPARPAVIPADYARA